METHNDSGDYCETVRLPGLNRIDRLCWLNIQYIDDPQKQQQCLENGGQPLDVLLPLNIAAIALLHPMSKFIQTQLKQATQVCHYIINILFVNTTCNWT